MSAEKFEEFRKSFPKAALEAEGGVELILIPEFKIPTSAPDVTFTALLCPQGHSGYDTRLFLDKPVPGRGQNWRAMTLLGRQWHVCSIRGISAEQSYLAILLAHVEHLK